MYNFYVMSAKRQLTMRRAQITLVTKKAQNSVTQAGEINIKLIYCVQRIWIYILLYEYRINRKDSISQNANMCQLCRFQKKDLSAEIKGV